MTSNSIKEIPGRGRCIVAERSFAPGDLVLLEEPYAMIVVAAYAEGVCSYCCTLCANGTMYALSTTSEVRYCSVKCITNDHPLNSLEAPAIAALEEAGVQGPGVDAMRLVFRAASCNKKEQTVKSGNAASSSVGLAPLIGRSNTFKHILLLEANTKSTTPNMAREVSRTAAELSNIATKCGLPLSAKDARSLLYSIQCNAHQILNSKEGETGVALGLFPYTSMMNHSCSPNCIHRFLIEEGRPPRLIMRAIANIAKGEELCYSYVNLYQSTEARRSQLESAYSFICECERCTAGSSSSTGVGQSSNEAPAPLASGILHYISDAPLDEFEESYDNSKVEEIEQFVVTSAGTNDSESLSRLKDFLSGSDAGKFHPAHRVLFLCYHYISVSSFRAALKNKSTNTSTVQSIRISIGNGLLALGCMRKYVMRIQTEIGHLEELLVSAIELLITQLHSSPCTHTTNTQQEVTENTERTDDIGSEFTPICCTSSRPSDFRSTHAVLDLLFENGYLKTSYWGALGDGRVRDLVELGCGFPKGDVTAATAATLLPSSSSSSSSSGSAIEEGESESHFKAPNTACVCHEVELNILQRMLIKFRISSEYIAYVCRAEVDEVDFEEQDVP